jgi:hypothetical protein
MLKGSKNFLMRGDVIVVAVGLSVGLAFSNLVKAFTDNIMNPLIAAAHGNVKGPGLGWQLVSGGGDGTYLNLGRLFPLLSTSSFLWRSSISSSSRLTSSLLPAWARRCSENRPQRRPARLASPMI